VWLESALGAGKVPEQFFHGTGCNQCGGTGYRGRVGVYELLELDAAMVAALRNSDLQGFSEAVQRNEGFHSLAEQALAYAIEGVTSLDEVMRIAGDSDMNSGR